MNTFLPSYDKMMYMEKIGGNDWILLAPELSVLHDNGIGDSELKYIHPDGRVLLIQETFPVTVLTKYIQIQSIKVLIIMLFLEISLMIYWMSKGG